MHGPEETSRQQMDFWVPSRLVSSFYFLGLLLPRHEVRCFSCCFSLDALCVKRLDVQMVQLLLGCFAVPLDALTLPLDQGVLEVPPVCCAGNKPTGACQRRH